MNKELFARDDTDSLRGLCMLFIIGHHLFQWTGSRYGVHYPLPAVVVFSNAGFLGSALFFLLSGYGTSLSLWKKKQTTKDILKRLSKIYLPYIYYWVIGNIILLTEGNNVTSYSMIGLVTFDLPVTGGG